MMDRDSKSAAEHERHAKSNATAQSVRCAVLTVSDTRTLENDIGGPLIERMLAQSGHIASCSAIVRDEPNAIAAQIDRWLNESTIHAILITGGTGVSRRDTTIEVVRRFLTVELEGFGELFRILSYEQVKAAAMLSRAVAGLVVRDEHAGGDTFIFAMPGSPNAVELAMSKLIAPQLSHLVWERKK